MREILDEQAERGTLRPSLEWWPTADVEELLRDPAPSERFADEIPSLPRSFYDHDVAVPDGWSNPGCGYVQLSEAYDRDCLVANVAGQSNSLG